MIVCAGANSRLARAGMKKSRKAVPKTIDEYLAKAPEPQRTVARGTDEHVE